MLTKRKKQIFDYIKKYIKQHDYSPSIPEMAKHFKLAVSTIHQHIDELERDGYLNKLDNQPRTIQISENKKSPDLMEIPLAGVIGASQPTETYETKETITVPKSQIGTGKHYALKVQGDSMIKDGILDGSVVIVKKQSTAQNGDTVVALINGTETTLKKFYQEGNKIKLQPANPRMKPIIVSPDNLLIQGKVVNIWKDFSFENKESKVKKVEKTEIKGGSKATLKKWLNTIQKIDCLKGLKRLPDNSCDVIIADPPYNIGKDFGNNIDKRELNEYVNWCKNWINECIRIMKPNGMFFIYGFSEILAHLSVEIPINKRWLIWHYTNKNVASLNFWQRSHEAILCCWKNKPLFNRDEVREPYTEGFLNGAAGKSRAATIGRFSNGDKKTIYRAHKGGALPRDVIKIPALAGGAGMNERWFLCKTCKKAFHPKEIKKHQNHNIIKHPTQKPLELSKKLIKSTIPKDGGIVLVPFTGTGSECVAAKELGKSYLGFEINPNYIKIANAILKKTVHQNRLL